MARPVSHGDDFIGWNDVWESAAELEANGDFASARDAFLVAADGAEEVGHIEEAREARRRSLQNHIAIWAKSRWPDDRFHPRDVTVTVQSRRRGGRLEFAIRRRNVAYANAYAYGTVGRRGDVRVESEPYRQV